MKLIAKEQDNWVFQLEKREKRLFCELLASFPLIPAAPYRISRSADTPALESAQTLLEESLAAEKLAQRKRLDVLLREENRFREEAESFRLTVSRTEMDWLLQVLNDLRVGSWLRLGAPEEREKRADGLTEETAPFFWAMELCAYFQSALLSALDEDR